MCRFATTALIATPGRTWDVEPSANCICSPHPRQPPILAPVRSGLLGGTFDPPHIAHLLAGEVAYRQLNLDRVVFMPAGSPWQKAGREVSAAQHRWAMSKLAVDGVEYFQPDDREVHREGWTYTADTLDTFDADDEVFLILGADAALGLPTWHRAADVLERSRAVVVPRPGIEPGAVEDRLKVDRWLDMPSLPVSGTMIRERAAIGVGFRFLVTEGVFDYVSEHNLYRQ